MLKKILISSLTQLFANRYLATLSIILTLLSLAFVVYIGFSVHPSELQLVTHYSAFGVTHLYRGQWWYLLAFALFGLLVAFLHIAIAIKIAGIKGYPLAVAYVWIGIGVILLAWVTSFSVINIWSPV